MTWSEIFICFRYIFRNAKKVGMQELGPRFTLKLRSLQKGTFDSKYGDYIWTHNVSASYYNTIHTVVVIKELSFFL